MNDRGNIQGRNGVVVGAPTEVRAVTYLEASDLEARSRGSDHRTYEIHQRERVGESTEKIKPVDLLSDSYRRDPYPSLDILREHYPFYRDWLSNSYWVTRYNDVTSIFVDEANFASRSKAWAYGLHNYGRNLGSDLTFASLVEARTDDLCVPLATELAEQIRSQSVADLAVEFAGRFALRLRCEVLGVPRDQQDVFNALFWRMQRGVSWHSALKQDGRAAIEELVDLLTPLLDDRRINPQQDCLSALLQAGEDVTAQDVVITLLEMDHETLHGAMANLWFNLLTHEGALDQARCERRLMKLAYLETLRLSPPVLSAHRYARHEVERFGKLIPAGARLVCSAGAANRDPTVFGDPDRFILDRKDLCQREPRGQYRADGLATGITFGLGRPSKHPAVPEDRPRSRYAIVRDTAVAASMQLIETLPDLRLDTQAQPPQLAALSVGEMHACWRLPVKVS